MRTRVLGVSFAAFGLATMGWALSAGGQQRDLPPLVVDYANYPDTPFAHLTAGCTAADVGGVSFTVNGGTPAGSLSALPDMAAGDVVTMSWAATVDTGTCGGSAISLVVKDAPGPTFDPSANQLVPPGGYNVEALDEGETDVSLTLPDLFDSDHGCAYQLDAVVGVPLAVIGPAGSFYSEALRGDGRRSTLISSRNDAYGTCQPPTTTTTSAPTTTTTSTPTSSTTSSSTTTTEPPAASTTSTTTASTTTTTKATAPTRSLAVTGGHRTWLVLVGMGLLLLGELMLLLRGRVD